MTANASAVVTGPLGGTRLAEMTKGPTAWGPRAPRAWGARQFGRGPNCTAYAVRTKCGVLRTRLGRSAFKL